MSRQVLWKVPQQLLESRDAKNSAEVPHSKKSWAFTDSSEQQRGEVLKEEEEGG